MLETIYQKLMILGFSDTIVIVTLLMIVFFIVLLILRFVIRFLINNQCETLISYIVSLLIIFLLVNEAVGDSWYFELQVYLYFITLATSILTLQLIYKKIIEK